MCLTLSPFIEVPVPSQESEPEWLCIFVGIDSFYNSFYNFSSGFWKYSDFGNIQTVWYSLFFIVLLSGKDCKIYWLIGVYHQL